MSYASLWYLLVGYGLGNGMPHFIFGVAGEIFRTPFAPESPPSWNIGWGLFNFIVATVVASWRVARKQPERRDLVFLLIGFWLAVAMFAFFIEMFLSN